MKTHILTVHWNEIKQESELEVTCWMMYDGCDEFVMEFQNVCACFLFSSLFYKAISNLGYRPTVSITCVKSIKIQVSIKTVVF
jgi:hypothetical protein